MDAAQGTGAHHSGSGAPETITHTAAPGSPGAFAAAAASVAASQMAATTGNSRTAIASPNATGHNEYADGAGAGNSGWGSLPPAPACTPVSPDGADAVGGMANAFIPPLDSATDNQEVVPGECDMVRLFVSLQSISYRYST